MYCDLFPQGLETEINIIHNPPTPSTGPNSPLMRSATGLRKKAAAATAALHRELRELSDRVEVMAASSKRRDKAQALKERASTLARSMEIKRIQVELRLCVLV